MSHTPETRVGDKFTVLRIDSNDPPDYSYIMHTLGLSRNFLSKVRTIVDKRHKRLISYYFDKLNHRWFIITSNFPSDADFKSVGGPPHSGSQSSWRSFKSHSRFNFTETKTSRVGKYQPRIGLYDNYDFLK